MLLYAAPGACLDVSAWTYALPRPQRSLANIQLRCGCTRLRLPQCSCCVTAVPLEGTHTEEQQVKDDMELTTWSLIPVITGIWIFSCAGMQIQFMGTRSPLQSCQIMVRLAMQ